MSTTGISISPARVAANRRNAQKSSGPKTAEGKARSRANAVKHGLTGAGIALPIEDEAEVVRRFATLQDEMGASSVLGAILVKQVALMSVRLDRSALQESAALRSRIRHAEGDFDQARMAEIDALFEGIEADPVNNRRRLLAFAEGIDRLVEVLTRVQRELDSNRSITWDYRFGVKIEALLGRRAGELPRSRSSIAFDAVYGNFRAIDSQEYAHVSGRGAKHRWARDQLSAAIGVELEKLATARAKLDPEVITLDRTEAAPRSLFDPGRDATLARRYEAEARRGLFRSLVEFREAEGKPDSNCGPEPESSQRFAEKPTFIDTAPEPSDHPLDPETQNESNIAESSPPVEQNETADAPGPRTNPDLEHQRTPTRNEPNPATPPRLVAPEHHPERWVRVVSDESPPRPIGGYHPGG